MKQTLKLCILSMLLIVSSAATAAETQFTASAPAAVAVGQTFQLVYNVNASAKDIRIPEIKGFDIVAGPFVSSGREVQFINGKMSSSVNTTFTYTLVAQKEGNYTITAASLTVDKGQLKSNAVSIKVLPPDADAPAGNQQGQRNNQAVTPSQQITADNLFLLPIVSRTQVHEQEAVLLTYKLYTRLDIVNVTDLKMPDFKDFMLQEIELDDAKRYGVENYKGRNYNTIILRQVLLFPQNAGNLTIDPLSCTAIVRVTTPQRGRGFFDSFFDTYQDVKKSLSTGRQVITAKALPSPRPTDFSGVVGSLAMTSEISNAQVDVNSPITIKLKISGSGNLKMLKNPALTFPADFETYEPKVTNSFSASTSGVNGSKTIEYLVIPRHDGTFEIPSVGISYFDLTTNSYKTIASNPFSIVVNKGNGSNAEQGVSSNYSNQEQVRLLANDIRYIKTGDLNVRPPKTPFVGSLTFWLAFIVPLMIAIALILFFQKQAKENADVATMRLKRANKVARKRLKIAEKNLKEGNKDQFYEEVLKALWGYLCDKLQLPMSDLNKENVAVRLSEHQVPQEEIEGFIALLNDCEFERFAPLQNSQAAMDKIYAHTIEVISSLENTVKRRN